MKAFLIITLVATLFRYIEGTSFDEHLLTRLKSDVCHMNNLISLVQQYYRDEKKYALDSNSINNEDTLKSATAAIGKARKLIGNIESGKKDRATEQDDTKNRSIVQDGTNGIPLTRRSNTDLQFKTNFYKALSRALKQEFPDDPLIQEHVHDGFIPPTTYDRRGSRDFD